MVNKTTESGRSAVPSTEGAAGLAAVVPNEHVAAAAEPHPSRSGLPEWWPLKGSHADLDDLLENLTWLRVYLYLHVAARTILMLLERSFPQPWMGGPLVLCCALGLVPRYRRVALYAVGAILSFLLLRDLPHAANHSYLELIVLGFLILLQEKDEPTQARQEAGLLDAVVRWILVIVITAGGLQKLYYGHYGDGTFLSWVTARESRFAEVLQFVIPADELRRLQTLPLAVGAGPFRVDSTVFVLLSNAVMWVEVLVPPLLLFTATRTVAAVGLIAFVVGIELGAREVVFGTLLIVLLALQLPGRFVKPIVIGLALLYVWLILAACGMLPGPVVNP